MSKKRIYELAKELNVSSKEVIAAAKKKGIEVGNHMSTIGENEERQVRAAFAPKKAPVEKKAAAFKAEKPAKEHKRESEKVGKKPSDKRSTEKKQAVRPDQGKTSRDQKSVNRTNERHSGNHMDKNKNNNNRRSNQREGQSNDRFGGNDNKKGKFNKKNNRKNNKRNNRNQRDNNKKNAVPQRKNKPLPETLVYTVGMNVADIAKKIHREPAEIIKKLFMMGVMVNQNQSLDKDTIEILAADYGIKAEEKVEVDVADIDKFFEEEANNTKHSAPRPPVVTIMGHVDHGKTTLLDKLRHTNVTAGEAGGITQHIGAYQVRHNDKIITFLDTPGHAAFTSMRARGADITDITVLVVAADDGVMPQTVEAISHAKAAGVEIIVAINKIDKPSANVERVKQELSEYELIPEDWGGSTIFVPVSAHTGEGIENLLEMILLTAEVSELKANPNREARGLVIEAQLDKGKGPVATILVQKGTLHVGDFIAAGACNGKVRAMMDDKGRRVKEAGPSTPVEILGLGDVPNAGEILMSFESDKEAKNFAGAFVTENKSRLLEETKGKLSLDNLFDQIQASDLKELPIIVKADVQGSVEAVKQSLTKLSNEEVIVKVIHGGVGAINESDVSLAATSNAIIIGFNVRPDTTAKQLAEQEGVDLRLYKVIYQAIEDMEKAMKGLLSPEFRENVIGHAEIRQTFKVSNVGTVAGCYVTDGKIVRNSKVRVVRDNIVVFEGDLASLRRFKDDVKEVASGYECGMQVEKFNDIKVGDIVEGYEQVEVKRK